MRAPFSERFQSLRRVRQSLLCVGLDPDPARIPPEFGATIDERVLAFLKAVVNATHDLAVAYKPNLAFFEALGPGGMRVFADLTRWIRERDPEVLIIADAKRGDIGNSASAYARAFFDELDCDGLTVNPYMGSDTLEPFLAYPDRAVIILCLTSNPGAEEFQLAGDPPLYARVARRAAELQAASGNVWLVVGATREKKFLEVIRAAAPMVPWLVPGIGAQGGEMAGVMQATDGMALINASRSILYAATNAGGVASAARSAAEELVLEMRTHLKKFF